MNTRFAFVKNPQILNQTRPKTSLFFRKPSQIKLTTLKKAVLIVAVIGVALVVSLLAFAALTLMNQQSHLSEHKIRRMKGFYAANAGIVDASEAILTNPAIRPAPGLDTNYVINNFASGLNGYPTTGYDINVTITNLTAGPFSGFYEIQSTSDYSGN